MPDTLHWIVDLSEEQVKAKYFLVPAEPRKELQPETRPWKDVPRQPLRDGLSYQLAITSSANAAPEVRLQRAAHPEIPVSGDSRSGVMILDGDRVVASLIMGDQMRLATHSDYRGKGLAQACVMTWCRSVKRLVEGKHPITEAAMNSILKARAALVAQRGGGEATPKKTRKKK